MIGVYVFQYDQAKWREKCVNYKEVDFLPKNEISIKLEFKDVDQRGFIVMPVTYGSGVKGPFVLMVKCKTEFFFTKMDEKFNEISLIILLFY